MLTMKFYTNYTHLSIKIIKNFTFFIFILLGQKLFVFFNIIICLYSLKNVFLVKNRLYITKVYIFFSYRFDKIKTRLNKEKMYED